MIALPTGYRWGEQSGDYHTILRGDRQICRVGGLVEKVGGLNRSEVYRAILRGECEQRQCDWIMGNPPPPLPDHIQQRVSDILARRAA